VKTEISKQAFTFMYRRQNKENYYINVANKPFENVENLKYLRENQLRSRGKVGRRKSRLNME
jgi:hypothetical protein